MAQIHIDEEFRVLMPPMSKDMREALKVSIAEKGVTDPVTVWTERGIILDGCYRFELALELGIHTEDIPVMEMSFPDENAAKLYRIEHNLVRRQLNTYQRIMAVEACSELFEAKEDDNPKNQDKSQASPKKFRERKPQQTQSQSDDDELKPDIKEDVDRACRKNEDTLTDKEQKIVNRSKRQIRREKETGYKKAKAAGTNEGTYRQALWIKASKNQDIIDAVANGEMSINKGYKLLKAATEDSTSKLAHHKANVHKAFILLQEAYQWLTTQQFEHDGENVTDSVRTAISESMFEPEQIAIAFDSFVMRSGTTGIISVVTPETDKYQVA